MNAQSFDYEYIGVVKLYKSNEQIISYRLLFSERQGKIEGVSITDLEGNHETKNKIEGKYDPKTKEIFFKETEILYTKSKISQNSFCFIHFSGKMKLTGKAMKLSGDFKGFFPDGVPCIDGEIEMIAMQKVEKLAENLSKKITKTKRISAEDKEKINPIKMLDSLKLNVLKNKENLSIFVKNQEVQLSIWDNGQIDNDQIDLFLNDSLVLQNYSVNQHKKIISIPLRKGNSTFRIVAKNEGKIAPNTARMEIKDGVQIFSLITGLKENEDAQIIIYKKN